MSGKKANNHPGLRPIKGQQSGLSGNTRARDQLSSLSLSASKTLVTTLQDWQPEHEGWLESWCPDRMCHTHIISNGYQRLFPQGQDNRGVLLPLNSNWGRSQAKGSQQAVVPTVCPYQLCYNWRCITSRYPAIWWRPVYTKSWAGVHKHSWKQRELFPELKLTQRSLIS
jgi:hypothetical protein